MTCDIVGQIDTGAAHRPSPFFTVLSFEPSLDWQNDRIQRSRISVPHRIAGARRAGTHPGRSAQFGGGVDDRVRAPRPPPPRGQSSRAVVEVERKVRGAVPDVGQAGAIGSGSAAREAATWAARAWAAASTGPGPDEAPRRSPPGLRRARARQRRNPRACVSLPRGRGRFFVGEAAAGAVPATSAVSFTSNQYMRYREYWPDH
jgi:hypothetical protein